MEQLFAYAKTERLWQLLLTLETLASFPLEARPTAPHPLTPMLLSSYETAIARADTAGLLHPVDVEALRATLSTWSEQSPLQQEIVRAIVDDCDALQSDPLALDKAAKLLAAWRQGHR